MTKINDEQLRILAYVAEHPNATADAIREAVHFAPWHGPHVLVLRGYLGKQPAMLKGIGNGYKITQRGEEVLAEHAARVGAL